MTDQNVNPEGHVDTVTTGLLNRARQGDETAWRRLVHVYLPLVYRWCKQRGLQEADAMDITQEVLLRVSKNLKGFRRDRDGDTFRGWLRTITRNAINDCLRKRHRDVHARGGSTARQVAENVPDQELDDSEASRSTEVRILYGRMVDLVRGEFSEKDWEALRMVVVEERLPKDVARVLGISRNQVYLAKSRIRKRLRDEFDTVLKGPFPE
ncbi:MAG: sigma-70 family RNA polymerase sigma factor [Planctomycetes bacterium]|nr:sigma-70 family RNA polymerase sigma factor [Planctomycetota bacterium]